MSQLLPGRAPHEGPKCLSGLSGTLKASGPLRTAAPGRRSLRDRLTTVTQPTWLGAWGPLGGPGGLWLEVWGWGWSAALDSLGLGGLAFLSAWTLSLPTRPEQLLSPLRFLCRCRLPNPLALPRPPTPLQSSLCSSPMGSFGPDGCQTQEGLGKSQADGGGASFLEKGTLGALSGPPEVGQKGLRSP